MKNKPLVIGAGVALLLWLMTRPKGASASRLVNLGVGTDAMGVDRGEGAGDLVGDLPNVSVGPAQDVLMTDSETGECLIGHDGTVESCPSRIDSDHELLSTMSAGQIGRNFYL